jgi:purine-binding chemotaxis protein CheW
VHAPAPVAKKAAPEPVKLATPAPQASAPQAHALEPIPYTGPAQRNGDPTTYKIKSGERFLCFNLGDQEYAIPLLSVKEVIGVPGFTPIPQSPHYFMGITNLRGTVIPVLDLPKKLSIPNKATAERAVIILDVGRGHLGIAVDSVNNVVSPQDKDISPRPETDPNVRTDYIIGVYRRDKQMVLFVDISKALGTDDWAAMENGTNTETSRAA